MALMALIPPRIWEKIIDEDCSILKPMVLQKNISSHQQNSLNIKSTLEKESKAELEFLDTILE